MGQFALGRELDELDKSATMPFHACYHELFEPDGVGQLLIAINSVLPIRWLPLEANRRFNQAHKSLRSHIDSVIQERIRALGTSKRNCATVASGNGAIHKDNDEDSRETNDLLSWMVAEKYYADGEDRWSEKEIRDQVSCIIRQPKRACDRNSRPYSLTSGLD